MSRSLESFVDVSLVGPVLMSINVSFSCVSGKKINALFPSLSSALIWCFSFEFLKSSPSCDGDIKVWFNSDDVTSFAQNTLLFLLSPATCGVDIATVEF